MLHRTISCDAVSAVSNTDTTIANLTYRSVDEAAKLGGETLRVYGRLVAHRIDAVMDSARPPREGLWANDGQGSYGFPVRAMGAGYDAWFSRH